MEQGRGSIYKLPKCVGVTVKQPSHFNNFIVKKELSKINYHILQAFKNQLASTVMYVHAHLFYNICLPMDFHIKIFVCAY